MCEAGVAENLDSPAQMNRDGEECQPSGVFSWKVTHHIKYPDICVIGNKVGGGFIQKGDAHIGGTVLVYERDFIPQSKTSNKEKYLH